MAWSTDERENLWTLKVAIYVTRVNTAKYEQIRRSIHPRFNFRSLNHFGLSLSPHHCDELLEINFTITVSIDLIQDFIQVAFDYVTDSSIMKDLTELLPSDLSVSIDVKNSECCPQAILLDILLA